MQIAGPASTTDYADLETGIRDLETAAIDAVMVLEWEMEGSCEAGSFRGVPKGIPTSDASPGGWIVAYPEGTWKDAYSLQPSPPPMDFTQEWARVDLLVESAVNRLRGIPEGSRFDDVVAALGTASAALSPGGVMLDGDGKEATLGVGNEALDIYVRAIDDKLGRFSGDAIENLKTYYTNRLETTLTGQTAVAAMLGVLAAGQAAIFDTARQDIADYVRDSAGAFRQLASNHHAEQVLNRMKVIDTALAIAGLVTEGALATKVGEVSGIYGVIDTWAPKPEISTKEVALEGDSPAAMLSDLNEGAGTLAEAIREAELAFSGTAERCLSKMDERPASFDISEPDFLSDKDKFWAPGENIRVLKDDLVDVGGTIRLISQLQASQATHIDDALQPTPWTREQGIGLGATGFHGSFHDVGSVLVQLLERSAKELESVAERCVLVAHDFQSTDEAVERELNSTSKEVQAHTRTSIDGAHVPEPK